MPDPIIPELAPRCQVVQELAKALRALKEPVDVTAVLDAIEAKLDSSTIPEAGLAPGEQAATIDLSKVDFNALEKKFTKSPTKKICRDMLAKLKTELLVLNWRKKRTSRAAVRVEIEKMLDAGLPEAYTVDLFEQKSGALFQHILEKYPERDGSVYEGGVA